MPVMSGHSQILPEKKAKRSHLSQINSEDSTDLFQGKDLLLLIPSGGLDLPIILLELGTGVKA